ncbi:chitobiase/beta-hexosaminidase C-terminal domain-containing protein [Capnocytophaga canimorsus]|nr:chitobiase/beta-hexosaminidase C-terminal domain-containing protein [Capnocytophaga canimorsus]WGU71248.1 chitobiase/beta-hexosaminidase C-terminal domain-containing protein [Capnocytophaga canimorsus]
MLESRNTPAISHISAHYYKTRPPQLSFFRNLDGMVTIAPMQTQFNWKPHGQNASENLNTGYEIFYTLDGSEPNENSTKYTEPFFVENKQLKAVSFNKGMKGAVRSEDLGILKKQWKVLNFSSEQNDRKTTMAFDAQPNTYWQSQKKL